MARAGPDPTLGWLLDPSHPAMRYLASRDLARPRPSMAALARLRAAVPRDPWVRRLMAAQRDRTWWARKDTCFYPKFRSTVWRLQVLADLGMTADDERIANAVEHFLRLHHDARHGGYSPAASRPGGGHLHVDPWMRRTAEISHLCLTGNMVRSLIRFGHLDDERVRSAIEWLVTQQTPDGGWHCFTTRYGTIDGWEAMSGLSEIPARKRTAGVRAALRRGAEFYLERGLLHEGKRFARWYWCRYPWHYHYDHLVGLDFMTAAGHGKDPRLDEAWKNLGSRRLADGRWVLDHTNGDLVVEPKGRPSRMVTFLALRAMRRAGRA